MNKHSLSLGIGDDRELEAFLAERIYEYNAQETGYFDGEPFHVIQRDGQGGVQAGIYGHTWGGCCYVSYLWVHSSMRSSGIGTSLLAAAEHHARLRGCALVILSTHSFQAPEFYAKLGYEQKARIEDHPVGFSSTVLVKRLNEGCRPED